ncbi:MAG TPA: hypothetical protein VMP10_03920 [Chloroflexota bacterium]|nr:hypothetical protein [Chloroflexota bacterium]
MRPISPVLQVIAQMSAIHGLGGVLLGGWILLRASVVTDAFLRRIEDFVARYAGSGGEIEVTEYRVWIGGVKQGEDSPSYEFRFFDPENTFAREYLARRSAMR